jgi:hypothetical protein
VDRWFGRPGAAPQAAAVVTQALLALETLRYAPRAAKPVAGATLARQARQLARRVVQVARSLPPVPMPPGAAAESDPTYRAPAKTHPRPA